MHCDRPFLNDLVLAVVAGHRRCREGSRGRNGEHVADSPHEYGLSNVCLLSGEPAAIRRVAGFDAYAWLITDPETSVAGGC